jgi:hypothetical protein
MSTKLGPYKVFGNITVDDGSGFRSVYAINGTPEALALILTGLAKKNEFSQSLVIHCHRGENEELVNRLFNLPPRESQ